MRASDRGVALFLATLILLICSLAGITMLSVAVSHIKHTQAWQLRARARYRAEAALVLAREKFWADEDYCGGDELLDTDSDQVGDTPVTITVSKLNPLDPDCPGDSNDRYDRREISVKVSY